MKKKLILHLGAHKTATTYIQDTLAGNNELLLKNNMYCIPRDEFREEVSRKYFYPKVINENIDFLLNDYLEQKGIKTTQIIFSEENLIGLVQEQITGNLYDTAKDRLLKIKSFIGDDFEIQSVIFCIRDYATYYPSLYCETLKSNRFYKFQRVKKNIKNVKVSWLGILSAIDEIFPGKLKVWKYEDFRDNQEIFFHDIMFSQKNIDLKKLEDDVRKGFGAEVVDVLSFIHRKYGKDFLTFNKQKKLIMELSGNSSVKFSPFSSVDQEQLVKVYNSDLEEIRKKYNSLLV